MNDTPVRTAATLAAALLLAVALSPRAGAAALYHSTMTYQGRLKEGGLPVTGARAVDIQICDALSGGNCYGSGGQNVSVSNGLFKTTFTAPSQWDPTAGPWYLEVRVAGLALSPREELTASPYAFYASTASGLVAPANSYGVTISSHLVVAGYVEIAGGTGGAHLRATQTTAPMGSADTNCGTSPVITVTGADMAGTIQFGSGGLSPPTSACTLKITFARAYAATPKAVLLTLMGNNQIGSWVGASSATNFTVIFSSAPNPSTPYSWSYFVVE